MAVFFSQGRFNQQQSSNQGPTGHRSCCTQPHHIRPLNLFHCRILSPKNAGLFVIFIACGSLAAVFIAALLMIRFGAERIGWNYPSRSNRHHQDYSISSRESQPLWLLIRWVGGLLGGGEIDQRNRKWIILSNSFRKKKFIYQLPQLFRVFFGNLRSQNFRAKTQ